MARRQRRTGRLVGALVVVVIAVLGIGWWLGNEGGRQGGHGPSIPGLPTPGTTKPRNTQPADCPDVEMIAVPGTWESSDGDDPAHPHTLPNAMLLSVTGPLQQRFPGGRFEAYTVPYVAQFRNPQRPQDITYDASRAEGTDKTKAELTKTHAHCPLTSFVLAGFSQGAVIAGDVTAQIGAGQGPVPADRVLGSYLVADGRRVVGAGVNPSVTPLGGQGMEVALQPATGITQLIAGATMTGARPGGFGALNDKTSEICAPDDLICNAPLNLVDGAARIGEFVSNNAVHAQYVTNPNVLTGTTVPAWMIDTIGKLVDAQPPVAH